MFLEVRRARVGICDRGESVSPRAMPWGDVGRHVVAGGVSFRPERCHGLGWVATLWLVVCRFDQGDALGWGGSPRCGWLCVVSPRAMPWDDVGRHVVAGCGVRGVR